MIYVPENPVVSIDPVVLVPVFPGFPNQAVAVFEKKRKPIPEKNTDNTDIFLQLYFA